MVLKPTSISECDLWIPFMTRNTCYP